MATAHGGLLAVFAHPDDEAFGVGGAMARAADAGHPVTVVCATRGEAGEIAPGSEATAETLGAHREQELRDACAVLGVHDVRFLDFRDSGMRGSPENDDPRGLYRAEADAVIGPLVRVIRERRPEVIVTWDAAGGYGHPDHVAVHHHAAAAWQAAGDSGRDADAGPAWRAPSLCYLSVPLQEFESLFAELRSRGIDLGELPAGDDGWQEPPLAPNVVIDVAAQYERKMAAIEAHRTQAGTSDMFMRIPEDIRRRFFSREFFHRAEPPAPDGVTLDDLFAGIG